MTDQAVPSSAPAPRVIPDRLASSGSWWKRWETILVVVAIAIFIYDAIDSPYFLDPATLSRASFNFTEQAIIGFAMALLIIAGEIDLSVAAIIAISSTAMGAANLYLGAPSWLLVIIGLAVGVLGGAVNGLIVTRFRVPSIVVTIGTMSLYRGISTIVLGDQVFRKYPPDFTFFGQGYVVGVVSFEFVLFLVLAVIFGVALHLTTFGRRIYAIGNNPVAAQFSGVPVDRIRVLLFCLTGLMSGVASVLLTSRIGSTRPTIATGYELQAITIVVLGGVNILGGSGTIIGVVIAAFITGLVTAGLGLHNVPGIVQSIVTGSLLIVVIAIPILWRRWRKSRRASG